VILDYLVFRVTLVLLVRVVCLDFRVTPVILVLLVPLVLPVLLAVLAKKAVAVVVPQVDRRPLRSARKLLV
jgi:hypothetical protein